MINNQDVLNYLANDLRHAQINGMTHIRLLGLDLYELLNDDAPMSATIEEWRLAAVMAETGLAVTP